MRGVSFDLVPLAVCLTVISRCFNLPSFMCEAEVDGGGFKGYATPIRFLSCGKEGIWFHQQFVRDCCSRRQKQSQYLADEA